MGGIIGGDLSNRAIVAQRVGGAVQLTAPVVAKTSHATAS